MSIRSSQRDSTKALPRLHHIFMPFFGLGADDRVALRLVLQLAQNPEVTATIVYFKFAPSTASSSSITHEVVTPKNDSRPTGASRAQSSATTASIDGDEDTFFTAMQRSLPADLSRRVILAHAGSSTAPLDAALARAQTELATQHPRQDGGIIVLGRHIDAFADQKGANAGAGAVANSTAATVAAPECLGAAADKMLTSGIRASIMVVSARAQVVTER
jgi:hypothetical protein